MREDNPNVKSNLYDRLQVLRGVSAICVLIDHVYSVFILRMIGMQHPLTLFMTFLGAHAVLIFFLLSGYLITLSCHRNIQKHDFFNAIYFIKSRCKRIYPPLLLSIVIIWLFFYIINYYSLFGSEIKTYGSGLDNYVIRKNFSVSCSETINAIIMNGGLLNPNGPLWSLYIEVKLYVLVMLLFITLYNSFFFKLSSAFFFFVIGYNFIFSNTQSFTYVYSAIWIIGAIAFYLHKQKLFFNLKFFYGSAILLSLIIFYMTATVPRFLDVGNPDDFVRETSKVIFSLLYAIIIFFIGLENKVLWFGKKTLMRCSKFSYSLYVLHFPILLFGLSIFQGWLGNSIYKSIIIASIMFLIAILISWISSFIVERKQYCVVRNQN